MEKTKQTLDDPSVLLDALLELRHAVDAEGRERHAAWLPYIERRSFRISSLNLAHYLALRSRDLRPIQAALMPWGLSSLGRSESRVIQSLDAVIATLGDICGVDAAQLPKRPQKSTFFRGVRMLDRHTDGVFGAPPAKRRVRIMVTFPTVAATDYHFVEDLLRRGMNCARINCAHDSPDDWTAMIEHVRRAESELGKSCKVFMDLGGPKNRTGKISVPKKGRVKVGDTILLTQSEPDSTDEYPVQIQLSLPEVYAQVEPGVSVWFDDGKIGAIVRTVDENSIVLKVTHARDKGEKLREDKGINFPDTVLDLVALTPKDYDDLDFVAQHADIVGYSFVQHADDVDRLQTALADRTDDPTRIAIVTKIETQTALDNLPELIVRAAGKHPFGVMIARGDLAVEIGYQRMAEIQEEILWLCEAANVPVIWATQVLERLVKDGTPSRAEMTDAAMAERAECVMLNKGQYIAQGVATLDDVLTRMQAHQLKKTSQLRALQAW